MTWTEKRSDLQRVKKEVENALASRYEIINEKNEKVFHSGKSGDFYICAMGNEKPWDFLVISYKEEDGDRFYPSDYDSLDSLVKALIAEIEG